MPGMARFVCAIIVLFCASLGACTCDERPPGRSASAGSPKLVPQPIAPPPPHHPLGPSPEEMRGLLDDDTLNRFLAYEQALVAAMRPSPPPVAAPIRKEPAKGKKVPAIKPAADVGSRYAAAEQAAMEKNGFSRDQVSKLGRVVSTYYTRAYYLVAAIKRAKEMSARVEAAKAQGREPTPLESAMVKGLADQTERLAHLRQEYATRYGEETLALFARHEADYFALAEQRLAGLGGAPAKP
jgi:hypothetical protein